MNFRFYPVLFFRFFVFNFVFISCLCYFSFFSRLLPVLTSPCLFATRTCLFLCCFFSVFLFRFYFCFFRFPALSAFSLGRPSRLENGKGMAGRPYLDNTSFAKVGPSSQMEGRNFMIAHASLKRNYLFVCPKCHSGKTSLRRLGSVSIILKPSPRRHRDVATTFSSRTDLRRQLSNSYGNRLLTLPPRPGKFIFSAGHSVRSQKADPNVHFDRPQTLGL